MDLKEYISTINQKYRAGNATEHSYRGALEQLMQTLLPKLRIVNEPKRVKCGAPDYIASRRDGMPQGERLVKLNQIAIQQMQVLEDNSGRKLLR